MALGYRFLITGIMVSLFADLDRARASCRQPDVLNSNVPAVDQRLGPSLDVSRRDTERRSGRIGQCLAHLE